MRRLSAILPLVVLLPLTGCSKKLPLEGKVTGYKPGSDTIVLVRVKSNSGANLECKPEGLRCEKKQVGAPGTIDLEVQPSLEPTKNKVVIFGEHGPKSATIEVPIEGGAVPPKVAVDSEGRVSCTMRDCSGTINLVTGKVSVKAQPGSVLEIGAAKATANAQGAIDAAMEIPTTPPLRSLPLTTLCTFDKKPLGSAPVALTFADKVKTSSQASFTNDMARRHVAAAFATAPTGPVLFAWEKPGATVPKKAALYSQGAICSGSATDATLGDVAVVVVGKDAARDDPAGCVYNFTDEGGKALGQNKVKLTLHDVAATAYDRLTGKVLGTKAFAAAKTCTPALQLKGNERLNPQNSFPEGSAIAAWGASLAR